MVGSTLEMLNNPPSKLQFKKMVRASVTNYWEIKLRGEASFLDSLKFFKPNFMSLGRPHPLWTTCRSDPYEVSKAVQQARFLSGRYRSESLARHWSQNGNGYCLSETCQGEIEDTKHILLHCRKYNESKKHLYALWLNKRSPAVYDLVLEAFLSTEDYLLQFLLDCSCLPQVVLALQNCST